MQKKTGCKQHSDLGCDLYQMRALSDELMNYLCQAKALLEPINDDAFLSSREEYVLKHYFYAFESIINLALDTKDQLTFLVDAWERSSRK